MSDKKIEILERALLREKKARKEAEKILENKALELYKLTGQLKETNNTLESLLAKKDLELKGVFKNIADAYCVMDMYGNVLEMNDATFDLLDCNFREESVNLTEFVHPEDVSIVINGFNTLKKQDDFKDLKIRIISKKQTIKHIHINASIIFNSKGKAIAVQGIARDFTHEFNIQQNLIESENRLKALILNLDSGILLEDEECNIIFTNTKFCEVFSVTDEPEELKGQHCSVRMMQSKALFDKPGLFMSRMQSIVEKKEEVLAEELKMKDGTILERDYIPIYESENYKGHLWTYRDVTLKRNYSKNLEAERLKYSSIIANMNLGLTEVNNDNEIILVNQSFSELTGYSESELLGMNALEVLVPEIDKESVAQLADDTRAGKSQSIEMRIKDKKGKIKSIVASSAPNYDYNGKVIGSIGVILDVTELAQTKKQLIEQKKQLDLIVQNSPIGIALFKRTGDGLLMVNKSLCDMFGYSEKELLTKAIELDPTHPDDLKASNHFREQLQKGEIDKYSIEKRYIKRDGSVIWAKSNFNAVKDHKGHIKNQVAIIEDITTQREKTLMLETINNVAKSILGKVDIYEIAWEITQNITNYLGSNDCVIYLADEKEQVLRQIAAFGNKLNENKEIVNHIEIPFGEGIVGHVAKTGKPLIIKDTSKDKRYITDDDIRFSEISVPIINDGKVIGVIDSEHIESNYFTEEHLATLQNVARLVSLQLKNAINRIERDKAERQNIQLLKQLEVSNNELQEYAHIVSHDLKSPLRSISALTSWVKEDNEGKLNQTSLDNITLIESTLERMEQLITDILDYSSVTSDSIELKPVDLNNLVKNINQVLIIPDHITLKIKENLPTIKGDRTRFQQLFQNLISNAVRYIDKENGLITIDFLENPTFYQFSISDNGIGIRKENHEKIFKIFNSLNESKESTGIGLSIVKKIIDIYGGEIWLNSVPGKGTTFYFTIRKGDV